MLARLALCILAAVLAAASAGCCHDNLFCGGSCAPCGDGALHGCLHDKLTCQAGCGELYIDEWISDPPDHCDPCDDCGNYVGHGHSCHHLWGFLHKLWGYRYVPGAGGPACGPGHPGGAYHGYAEAVAGAPHDDYVMEGGAVMRDGHVMGGESFGSGVASSGSLGDDFYEVGPGETLVPGSVRITEGGVVGEPTPAATPEVLPGPSGARTARPPTKTVPSPATANPSYSRPAAHRQIGYRPSSPRQRPRTPATLSP